MSKTSIEWCDFSINPLRARYAPTDGEAPTRENSQRRPDREIDGEEELPSERRREADRGRWRQP